MKFIINATAHNTSFKNPIEHKFEFKAKTRNAFLKQLNLSTKNICDLRNKGETSWVDHKGVSHTWKLEETSN